MRLISSSDPVSHVVRSVWRQCDSTICCPQMSFESVSHIEIELPSDIQLQADIWKPSFSAHARDGNKLAVCLHPWSWLGGRKDDPYVLYLLHASIH